MELSGRWLHRQWMLLSRSAKSRRSQLRNMRSDQFPIRLRRPRLVSASIRIRCSSVFWLRMNAKATSLKMRTVMKIAKLFWAIALGMAVASGSMLAAQVQTIVPPVIPGAKPVAVEHIKIHGVALEGNLEGDAVDRDVIVFLPPSYSKDEHTRYPVVYTLHGYSIGAEQCTHEIHVPQTIEGAFAQGANEMIVVLPDSKTIYNGSMYSSSVTTGDFENYIAHDVVAYIDAHYRTIPERTSRGLVGHSMGGYGASRIGMKHPDVFSALYIMSPCCLSPMGGGGFGPADKMKEMAIENEKKIAGAK